MCRTYLHAGSCSGCYSSAPQVTNPVPGFSAVLRRLALTVNPKKYADQKEGYETDFLLIVLSDGFAMTDKWASGYFVNEVSVVVCEVVSVCLCEG